MKQSKRRHVESFWYENGRKELINQIEWCYNHKFGPNNFNFAYLNIERPVGIVAPHAGFSCSGPYSAIAFEALKQKSEQPDSIIILGPNHTGMGPPISIFPNDGIWETPLGDITIDKELAEELFSEFNGMQDLSMEYDESAHIKEHSIDNQLPFLQKVFPNTSIVPICIMDQRFRTCSILGQIIAKVIQNNRSKKRILIVSSSDFTHYVEHQQAEDRDSKVIERLVRMELELAETIKKEENVTACGFGPIIALFTAAQILGNSKAVKLAYGSSGLTCSSKSQVVGYGAILV